MPYAGDDGPAEKNDGLKASEKRSFFKISKHHGGREKKEEPPKRRVRPHSDVNQSVKHRGKCPKNCNPRSNEKRIRNGKK